MQSEIPGIVDIHAGPNTSPEGKNKGYGLGLVVRFHDAAARDAAHASCSRVSLGQPASRGVRISIALRRGSPAIGSYS